MGRISLLCEDGQWKVADIDCTFKEFDQFLEQVKVIQEK